MCGSWRTRQSTTSLGMMIKVSDVLFVLVWTFISRVRVTISCKMMFDDYPLDAHECQFQVGSCKNKHDLDRSLTFDFSRLWHNRDCGLHLNIPLQRQEAEEPAALYPDPAATRAIQSCRSSVRWQGSKEFWTHKNHSSIKRWNEAWFNCNI